jgi:hypothetical protein
MAATDATTSPSLLAADFPRVPARDRVRGQLWLYPPRIRPSTIRSRVMEIARPHGVEVDFDDVSLGLSGTRHEVFAAIEEIFATIDPGMDIAFVVTVDHRRHEAGDPAVNHLLSS